ncbi:MAG TPA: serine/threonine-protein kinase, partial [Pseudomonadota bacterium]|nr:serine/threonine-protein kinase [Pseudomonadota bacterium]
MSQPNGAIISGRYRIEGVLGSGGMGTVYLAQHTHMRKRVALKMLHAETSQVPELVARFEREAVAMSRAEHPNIATATDFGRAENGAFFLVLEYIEGYSLRQALKTGPMEVRRVAHIVRQIASALERSHELGIIHRDLKPENIMLVPRQGDVDYVKILDFGLAKLAPEALEVEGESAGQAITRHGSVFGTPRYMAPEQCVGEDVDVRADLYALGLILYEALTGLHPFNEREPRKMIRHHLFTPIPPMKTRAPAVTVPPSIDALVMPLLEKPRGKRHASANELLAAVRAKLAPRYAHEE